MILKHQERGKRLYERAVKCSISMPLLLNDRARAKTRQLGFATFSDYIQELIRRDTTLSVSE